MEFYSQLKYVKTSFFLAKYAYGSEKKILVEENCKQKIATKWGKKAYYVITSSILQGMLNMQKAKQIFSIRAGTISNFRQGVMFWVR